MNHVKGSIVTLRLGFDLARKTKDLQNTEKITAQCIQYCKMKL